MKKILSSFLLIVCIFNLCAIVSFADNTDETPISITNEDGSITYDHGDGTSTTVYPVRKVDSTSPQTRSTLQTTAGAIDVINTDNSSGAENWKYTLIGYFAYDEGVSCVCTNATHEVTITNDWWWHFSEGGNSWSGNAAYGVGKFEYKVLFVTTETVNIDLRIRCDSYGNFY